MQCTYRSVQPFNSHLIMHVHAVYNRYIHTMSCTTIVVVMDASEHTKWMEALMRIIIFWGIHCWIWQLGKDYDITIMWTSNFNGWEYWWILLIGGNLPKHSLPKFWPNSDLPITFEWFIGNAILWPYDYAYLSCHLALSDTCSGFAWHLVSRYIDSEGHVFIVIILAISLQIFTLHSECNRTCNSCVYKVYSDCAMASCSLPMVHGICTYTWIELLLQIWNFPSL